MYSDKILIHQLKLKQIPTKVKLKDTLITVRSSEIKYELHIGTYKVTKMDKTSQILTNVLVTLKMRGIKY